MQVQVQIPVDFLEDEEARNRRDFLCLLTGNLVSEIMDEREVMRMAGTGLNKNTAAALSYVLGPITGVIFLVLEKDPYVRFHAMQSIVTFVGLFILDWVLIFTVILAVLVPLVGILGFVLWLLLIYKAWKGEEWEVPVFGKISRQLVSKV